jgi:multiple antibiotic resistance protein
MPAFYNTFIHLLFTGIIALFPVVNPIGSAFIVSPYLLHLSQAQRRLAVGKIALYSFLICTVSLFVGHYILQLFGISIPIVQLAGGIMICKIGWEFLSSDKKEETEDVVDPSQTPNLSAYKSIQNKLFYPITFPITAGAGTISVLFTLSAHSESGSHSDYLINASAILCAILFICFLIYLFYVNIERLIHILGDSGEMIVNRITAFLIFCVGLQIALTGLKVLFKI